MSTDIVKHQQAGSLDSAVRFAQLLSDADLLPRQFVGRPANVLYAVEYGRTLGITPVAAITGIHVIEGKPSASSGLIGALVRKAGHKLRVKSDGMSWATAQIVRADDPDFTYECTWNLERAAQAGLCKIEGGKPVARDSKGRPTSWEKYTAAMLKARAITEVARDACEDVLFGLHYTPEELGAHVNADGEPVEAEVQQLRRVQPGETDQWAGPAAGQGATPPEQALADAAATATDSAKVRDLYQEAKDAGLLATTVKVGDDSGELGAYLIARGQELAQPAPTGDEKQGDEDDVPDAETVDEGTDEHAAAVAELRAFAAENGIADIDAAAYPHLGAPLDDVAPAAIRQLTAQLRASAA